MKQFRTIFSFELQNYFKNRVFLTSTAILMVVIAAVMFWPSLKAGFSDREETEEAGGVLLVTSADGSYEPEMLEAVFGGAFPEYEVRAAQPEELALYLKGEKLSPETASEAITAGETEMLILAGQVVCAFEVKAPGHLTYYVENIGMTDMNAERGAEALRDLMRLTAMVEKGVDPASAQAIMGAGVELESVALEKDTRENYLYTYIMVIALYTVIMIYGQMVATNVAAEKSSRAMEVLITSTDPVAMMFGKVLASGCAGLTQLLAVFGSAFLFYNLNRDAWGDNFMITSLFGIPASLLLYMLVFFLLGFFLYAFLYGAVGSTVSKTEEVGTAVQPITLLFVAVYMVVIISLANGSVDNLAMKICSFIPFTSPMAMFTRIAMSTVAPWEKALSIGLLAAGVVGVGVLAAKIYRVGVLMYGTPPKPKDILKAIRKA